MNLKIPLFILLLISVSFASSYYDYWVDDTNTSNWGEINLKNSTQTLYWYGNCTKESESNGSEVFAYWDDLGNSADYSDDTNLDGQNGWTDPNGRHGVKTYTGDEIATKNGNTASGNPTLYTPAFVASSENHIIEWRYRVNVTSGAGHFGNFIFFDGATNRLNVIIDDDGGIDPAGGAKCADWVEDDWFIVGITQPSANNVFDTYVNGSVCDTGASSNSAGYVMVDGSDDKIRWSAIDDTDYEDLDWVRARKNNAQPSITYGDIETGSFSDGEGNTCGYRVEINITGTEDIDDYQVELNYTELGSNANGTLTDYEEAGNDSVNVTLHTPTDASISLNKTTEFIYQVDTNRNASCMFYRNGINEYNDTAAIGYTNKTHTINQTYGLHNWSVYCEQDADATVNDTSATWDNEVYFNVTQILPDNGVLLIGNTTQFNYSTTNYYDIECNLTVDGSVEDNRTVSSSSTIDKILNISSGSHTWSVTCYGADNLNYSQTTPTRSFDMNYNSYDYIVNLSTAHENIFAEPQAMFYDIDGNLNVLYFTDQTPDDYIKIQTINVTTIEANYTAALNRTKNFFIAFRNPTNTSLLTFGLDNVSAIFIDINGGTTVTETVTAINADGNEEFDPYTYAYTKQFSTIDYVSDSYYLFMLPTTGGTKVIKKNVTSHTLEDQGTVNDNCEIVWNTMAKNQNLTEWYYVAPENIAANNYITLYEFNGSTSTEIHQFGTDLYSKAKVEGITIIFEHYEGATYVLMVNATDTLSHEEDALYYIEGDVTYDFGENLESPSHFFFIENDTFVFFDTQSGTEYAYSCYYNGSVLDCLKFDASDYGATVPYERGAMATAKRDSNNNDEVSKGLILSNEVTQLIYNRNTYDTKFICYDEVAEFRKNFTVQVYTDNSSTVLSSQAWGYVLPSDLFGTGTKKAYFLCSNGTNRLFVAGLAGNFQIDSYSLNTWEGAYYTFLVEDNFGVAVQGATITAYRFSTDKQAWVIIEQAITDFSGSGVLFLQQYNLYKIVIDDGSILMNFDFVPATYTTVEVELAGNLTNPVFLPNYEYVWNDVSYSIEPDNTYSTDPININYTVISNSSSLEYYGMKVLLLVNGSSSTVYNQNITTQPTGGILNYTAAQNGTFYVYTWFKHQNYTEQEPFVKVHTISGASGIIQAKEDFAANAPVSGWALYFLAVIVAALVGGYVYQYTEEGAGIAVILTLGVFTWFMPDAEIVCLVEDACITAVHITILTALAVLSAIFVRRSM